MLSEEELNRLTDLEIFDEWDSTVSAYLSAEDVQVKNFLKKYINTLDDIREKRKEERELNDDLYGDWGGDLFEWDYNNFDIDSRSDSESDFLSAIREFIEMEKEKKHG